MKIIEVDEELEKALDNLSNLDTKKDIILESNTKMLDLKPEDWTKLLADMNNPIESQKEIAAKMKILIDNQMRNDILQYGKLTDQTRRFLSDYTNLLSSLHKDLHGTKSTTDINVVSHAHISAKIREASKIVNIKPEEK